MTQILLRQILAFLSDLLLFFFFFRKLPLRSASGWNLGAMLAASCLPLIPVYFISPTPHATLVFLLRTISALVFLQGKKLQREGRWFLAAFYAVCYTAVQNMFLVPFFSSIYLGTALFTGNPVVNTLISTALRGFTFWVVFLMIDLAFPLEAGVSLNWLQVGIMSPLIICELYVKYSLSVLARAKAEMPAVVSSYPILMQMLLLAFVVLFERYLKNTRIRQELQMQSVIDGYRIRDMEARNAAASDLRSLHHDMKNHLLMLRQLAHAGDLERLDSYVSGLMESLSPYEVQVQTGNRMLNALLSAKSREAQQKGIAVSIAMDFSPITYIPDSILCTIFGNLLDNAIEACMRVGSASNRFVQIRSYKTADQLLIVLRNSFQGKLRRSGEDLLSTKDSSGYHGFGFRNIRRAAERYKGRCWFETEENSVFVVNLMLPLYPETPGSVDVPRTEDEQ